MLTKIIRFFKRESKTYIRWKRNLLISLLIGFFVGIVVFFVFPSSPWAPSFLSFLLATELVFVVQVQIDMVGFFHDVVEHNPIIRSLPEISKKVGEIPNLTMKEGSLDFAVESFRKMANEGFVQLNVEVGAYIKYLLTLSANAKDKIYGTNIFRPKVLLKKIKDNTPGIKEYLKIMRESKCKRKIRINILPKEIIKKIIRDAIISLEPDKQKGKVDFSNIEFIPEIVWYLKEINGWQSSTTCQKIDNLWTTHNLAIEGIIINNLPRSETSTKEIDDYAIFDDQILFLYDHNEDVDKGTIVLQWDTESKEMGKVQTYLRPFVSIAEQLQQGNDVYANTNLFSNFSALVNEINWGVETFEFSVSEVCEKNEFENIVNLYFVKGDNCPRSMYKKLEELIKNDGFKFKDMHFDDYFKVKI